MAADILTNLVGDLDDHDLSVLNTRNTQNGLVGVACVNPLPKKFRPPAALPFGCGRLRKSGAPGYHVCAQIPGAFGHARP